MRGNMKKETMVAIIGGSGLEKADFIDGRKKFKVNTPFGSAEVVSGKFLGAEVLFLARHGAGHSIAPHKINYRANIFALEKLGATHVIATAAVGSLKKNIKPGEFAVLNDFIDFTKSRAGTFFDGAEVVHTDMSEPYNKHLSRVIRSSVRKVAKETPKSVVYAATEGPRFETKAEIRMYAKLGADVVGMTGVPEVALANELGLHYAALALVTNFAAGISCEAMSMRDVKNMMQKKNRVMIEIIRDAIRELVKIKR